MDTPIDTILYGDCLEILRQLPDNQIDCVITSPPYWGLRDCGIEINPDYIAIAEKRIEKEKEKTGLLIRKGNER